MDLYGRSLLSVADLSPGEFIGLVDFASEIRAERRTGLLRQRLCGRSIAVIFERPSTGTLSAFEVAAHDEGGHVTHIGPGNSHLRSTESVKDAARVLGRMFDGIEFRGYSQADAETLARFAGIPVWNGLTDLWHPTQMLADVLTMRDQAGKPLHDVVCCYLGDGRQQIANSLLVTGALLGLDVRICAPKPLWPTEHVRHIAQGLAYRSGVRLFVTDDPDAAVRDADFLYTDAWLSTSAPAADWHKRITMLLPYRVNARLMRATGNPATKFMHCLPAMHNLDPELARAIYRQEGMRALEVTEEVFESPASVVFDQSENRLHAVKATMLATILPARKEIVPNGRGDARQQQGAPRGGGGGG